MSATIAMALPPAPLGTTEPPCCPNCGYTVTALQLDETQNALLDAQKRIADLEAQVRLLNQKATAAVDRWADYEDEISRLRAAATTTTTTQQFQSPVQSVASPTRQISPTRGASFLPAGAANRISALLSPRKSTPNLRTPPPSSSAGSFPPGSVPLSPTPSNATAEDLIEALSREQNLRMAAESRLSTTSKEVEELSVALFEQANEMVATERKARAKLEQRVEVLEQRDQAKRRRLERLESAMGRIERVRALLDEDGNKSPEQGVQVP